MPMHPASTARRPTRESLRHIGAGLLLALQLAMAAFALFEPRAAVRLGEHVEQDGALHADQHGEDSCAVCAARTLSALPSPGTVALSISHAAIDPQAATLLPPPAVRFVSLHSRAPPALPG